MSEHNKIPTKESRKQTHRNRVSSGKMTQLMVLLNGIILTATAFLTLNVFIEQMREDEFQKLNTTFSRAIYDELVQVDRSMHSLSAFFALGDERIDEQALRSAVSLLPEKNYFDRLMWFRSQGERSWLAYNLYMSDSVRTMPEYFTKKPSEYVRDVLPFVPSVDILMIRSDLTIPMDRAVSKDDSFVLESKPFMVVKSVIVDGKISHVLVGLVRLADRFNMDIIEENDAIAGFELRDTRNGASLLQMTRPSLQASHDTQNKMPVKLVERSQQISIGNTDIMVYLKIKEDIRMAFISKIPYLLLIFGLTLTLIGTLYVRNNQRQSLRLRAMNEALAGKNKELSDRVEETDSLYNALQKSQQEYKAVINAVSDIIIELDEQGNILFLNETWERIMRFGIPHSLGRDFFDLLDSESQERNRDDFYLLLAGHKEEYSSTSRIRTAEGKWRSVEISMSLVNRSEHGEKRIVGTITDIEAQERAARALSEAEKKYQTIVDNAAGGIYQVTPEGQIMSANPSLARILGFSSPDELKYSIIDISVIYVNKEDRRKYMGNLEQVGFVRNMEAQILRKDGSKIWINENARAVRDEDGQIRYYEGSIEDITQRREALIGLKEAKIQSDLANRAKSEFLANMSHELRTPLNSIIGFSEIIKSEALGKLGQPAYKDYSTEIYDSGKKLLSIINEILDISRIDAGERQLNESVVSLQKVVEASVGLMRGKADDAKIEIQSRIDAAIPKIIAEELAFKQMIMNLLSNAIKFTSPGGRVTIDAERDNRSGDMRLSITDTGIGIDESDIGKALSAFGQLDGALSRSNSGTGLGLTIVNSLIKLHGGRLELVSQKGIGTTVSLVIPVSRIAAPEEKAEKNDAQGNVTAFKPRA